MHKALVPVQSSNIDGVWFSSRKGIMLVAFESGKTYSYENVDRATYDGFMTAPSKGQYLNSEIKPRFNAVLVNDSDIEKIVMREARSIQHPVLDFLL